MTGSRESQQMLAAYGVFPISEQEILAAVGSAVRGECAHPIVARNDWARLHDLFAAGGEGARFGPLLSAPAPEVARPPVVAPATEAPSVTLDVKLAKVPLRRRQAAMEEILLQEVAGVLGESDVARLTAERGFQAMGVDSLMALDLRTRIGRRAQRELPATMIYDFPNVRALAAHLLGADQTARGVAQ
jgi:acyl carrier protein